MILLLSGAAGVWVMKRAELPPVEVLTLPVNWPATKPSRLQQIKARLPGWFWRAKYSVLGKPVPITLRSTIYKLEERSASLLPAVLPGEVDSNSIDGLRVLRFDEAGFGQLVNQLDSAEGIQKLASPRASTAHKVSSTVFTGTSIPDGNSMLRVGEEVSFLPRARRGKIDLTVLLKHTEAITNLNRSGETRTSAKPMVRTNVPVSARVQLPARGGVLLVNDDVETMDGSKLVLLISGTIVNEQK